MSRQLLLDESPLLVLPSLAVAIGLNEAIILQQLHYWIKIKQAAPDKYADGFQQGRWWVYNSVVEWQKQFNFWSDNTIQRALASLRSQGLVHVERLAEDPRDRTNWYAIDYERLDALAEATPSDASAPSSIPLPDAWPRRPSPGFVYLLGAPQGRYKIGKARHIPTRLTQLAPALPFAVTLEHSIPCEDYTGAEQAMHSRFAPRHLHGEWFALTEEDVAWIKDITTWPDAAPAPTLHSPAQSPAFSHTSPQQGGLAIQGGAR